MEKATFGGGCFWCTEAVFKRLKGVESVTSGYSGGNINNPSYEQVSSGSTDHAEAVQIVFQPKIINFDKLLEVFWATHDPTTKDRQGNDVGSQYRSVIFYHDEGQKKAAVKSKDKLDKERVFNDEIVTEIVPFENFYPAEEYHQNYYDNNKSFPYCALVINPKVKKLLEKFGNDVKREYL
jgi:peptide-methionine (S)-S-oxide reductase